jgi:hypothetical protein
MDPLLRDADTVSSKEKWMMAWNCCVGWVGLPCVSCKKKFEVVVSWDSCPVVAMKVWTGTYV